MRNGRTIKGLVRKCTSAIMAVALVAAYTPSVALAAEPTADLAPASIAATQVDGGLGLNGIDDDDDDEDVVNIASSERITVKGETGNSYLGVALDPITLEDSDDQNGWITKTTDPNEVEYSDYYVEYKNNLNAGTAEYKITGCGDLGSDYSDYHGVIEGQFEIAQANLSATLVSLADDEKGVYLAGDNAVQPKVKVILGYEQKTEYDWDEETYESIERLVDDEEKPYVCPTSDYTLIYRDSEGNIVDEPKAVGTYTVEAKAASANVKGTTDAVEFTITDQAIPLDDAEIAEIYEQEATGSAIVPDLDVTLDGTPLEKGIDYTVECTNNVHVGTATVVIHGTGIYTGSANATFDIVQGDFGHYYNIIEFVEEQSQQVWPWAGKPVEPAITVKIGDAVLVEGTDYEVSYEDNTLADDEDDKYGNVVITGKGDFKGTTKAWIYTVRPIYGLDTATVYSIEDLTFTGRPQAINMDITNIYLNLNEGSSAFNLNSKTKDVYYTVSYEDADGNAIADSEVCAAGDYKLVLTAIEGAGLTGVKKVDFSIAPADFADVAIADIPTQTMKIDGTEPEPVPTITYTTGTSWPKNTYALQAGKDFTVDYVYPEEIPGTAEATITPTGNFTGAAKNVWFDISDTPIEAVITAPITWTAPNDGHDTTSSMRQGVDGKVSIASREDGKWDVTLTPINSALVTVTGFQYPVGTDVAANEDGTTTIVVDSLSEGAEVITKMTINMNGRVIQHDQDQVMHIDVAQAAFDLEDDVVYTAAAKWSTADGSESMTGGYVDSIAFAKTSEGTKAAISLNADGAEFVASINDDTEAPYIIDIDPMGTTAVTFTFDQANLKHDAKTAYLTFVEANAVNAAKQETANQQAAQDVVDAIAVLPAKSELTLADKAAVTAARTAYSNLPSAYQSLVTNLSTLEAAEAQITALEAASANQAAASAVIAQINALPAKAKLTVNDKSKVTAARTAYNKLTAAQKALVTNLATLTAAEQQIAALEKAAAAKAAADKAAADKAAADAAATAKANQTAANAVIAKIKALPAKSKLKLTDKAKVTAARTAYNKLTASQKKLVTNLSTLTAAEKQIATLEAKAKKVTSITVNTATVSASSIASALAKKGGSVSYVKTITLGAKVKKISASAFAKCPKATKLVVKTKKLKKTTVKNSLKGSKVKTIQVNVGSSKVNKTYVKSYKKIFTKKIAGKAATVK